MNILIPTDFSNLSVNALKAAIRIAEKTEKHQITVVHLYEAPYSSNISFMGDNTSRIYLDMEKNKKIISALKTKMQTFLKIKGIEKLNVKSLIIKDVAIEKITKLSKIGKHDLIIMSSRGASGVQKYFLGSNTQKVLRTSKIPVLVVKNKFNLSRKPKTVFVSDFKEKEAKYFKKLKPILKALNVNLRLLKIITPINFESSMNTEYQLNQFGKVYDLENAKKVFYNHTSVEGGVRAYCQFHNIELITMLTHGRTGLNQLVFGSVTEDMTKGLNTPVLSLKID